jgi:hypothetical protein
VSDAVIGFLGVLVGDDGTGGVSLLGGSGKPARPSGSRNDGIGATPFSVTPSSPCKTL